MLFGFVGGTELAAATTTFSEPFGRREFIFNRTSDRRLPAGRSLNAPNKVQN